MSDAQPKKATPVTYAEDNLGVHEVYNNSMAAHDDLNASLGDHAREAKELRRLHDEVDTREYELATEVRASDPTISQEALKRAIRDAQQTDESIIALRRSIRDAQDRQEDAQALVEMNKYRLRVLSARMNELGGLLAFYAAVKSSSKPSAR